jgi:hypothetical protein
MSISACPPSPDEPPVRLPPGEVDHLGLEEQLEQQDHDRDHDRTPGG